MESRSCLPSSSSSSSPSKWDGFVCELFFISSKYKYQNRHRGFPDSLLTARFDRDLTKNHFTYLSHGLDTYWHYVLVWFTWIQLSMYVDEIRVFSFQNCCEWLNVYRIFCAEWWDKIHLTRSQKLESRDITIKRCSSHQSDNVSNIHNRKYLAFMRLPLHCCSACNYFSVWTRWK